MKYLILAAGYGTRLETDVRNDTSGKFTHLVGVPKPLVPLAGKALITYWVDALRASGVEDEDVFLVTNHVNLPLFLKWAESCNFPAENVVDDCSVSNATRLGAIRDINMVVQQKKINDDICILGGDTLFFDSFHLVDVVHEYESRRNELQGLLLWYPCLDAETTSTGILLSNEKKLIYGFVEKPRPTECESRQASPCFYIYGRSVLPMIAKYVEENAGCLRKVDAPGTLVGYLCSRANLLAHRIDGRFDIGGLATFVEADEYFVQHMMETKTVLMGPKVQEVNNKCFDDAEPTVTVSPTPLTA